ncbi:MAG: hypothetical protein OIF32_02630 [Campylobacterales bacterium]|nr:hypothetical protein [Campylobacterales bacterium]
MIFRTLIIMLLATAAVAVDYKYKFGSNQQCVYHGFEKGDSNSTTKIYSLGMCDGFSQEDKTVFLISNDISYGRVKYHEGCKSKGTLFYGGMIGGGNATLKTYGGSYSKILYTSMTAFGGYEREIYKGLIFNIGGVYRYLYAIDRDLSLSNSDKEREKTDIADFGIGSTYSELQPFFLFGIRF